MAPFATAPSLDNQRRGGNVTVVYGRNSRRQKYATPPPQQSEPGSDQGAQDMVRAPRTSATMTMAYSDDDSLPYQLSGLRSPKQQPKMAATTSGPDPPPTPPNHSRAASSTHSVVVRPEGVASAEVPARNASPPTAIRRSPATPPSQRSPPTPDVTPPAATSGHDDRDTEQSLPPSATFQSRSNLPPIIAHAQGRQEVADGCEHRPQKQALRSQTMEERETIRPTASARDQQRRPVQNGAPRFEGPPEHTHLRNMGRTASAPVKSTRTSSSTHVAVQRTASAPSRPTKHAAQTSVSSRKASAASMSSWCTTSDARTDVASQKTRTLRHVRKSIALRDPLASDQSLAKEKIDLAKSPRPPQVARSVFSDATSRRDDCASALSNNTSRSISSNRARREIWRSGAIPVVIVPERSSSQGPGSRDASLKSASSKRSRNTVSAISASLRESGAGPVFERRNRRDRRNSEPGRMDQRTVDFAPIIPARSSSLSAPTSRNVSRAPSIKSSSTTKATGKNGERTSTDASSQPRRERQQTPPPAPPPAEIKQQQPVVPEVKVITSPQLENSKGTKPLFLNKETLALANRLQSSEGFGGEDELMSPPLLPSLYTPYSGLSIQTYATAPELSEALLVHMYQHQNTSVMLVNNAGRPSVIVDKIAKHPHLTPRMRMRRTTAAEKSPATPPLKRVKLIEAHSPLRHPREPPRPPLRTASSLPARMRTRERPARQERPPRQLDLMKRAALSRKRQAADESVTRGSSNFLSRTLSLSRARRGADDKGNNNADKQSPNSQTHEVSGANETDLSFEDLHVHDIFSPGDIETEMLYYPPVDNRPQRAATIASTTTTRRRRRRRSRSASTSGPLSPITPPRQGLPSSPFRAQHYQNFPPPGAAAADTALSALGRRRSADFFQRATGSPLSRQAASFRASKINQASRGARPGESTADDAARARGRFSIGGTLGEIQNIPHLLREKRREKRTQKLRMMISAPREVRDGVGEVIQRGRAYQQPIAATHV